MGIKNFFEKAFSDMKESARAQHQVDKANLAAAKAEAKASFEENRGSNTYAKARENAKRSWDDAHLSPAQRAEKIQKERQAQIDAANARTAAANARCQGCKRKKQQSSES